MQTYANLSMIEIVDIFLNQANEPQTLNEIVAFVASQKNFEVNDTDKITQLYQDITTSGKYIYMGENKWDLKQRNLEYWDKEGTFFISEAEKEALLAQQGKQDLEDDDDYSFDELVENLKNIDDYAEELDSEELTEKLEEAEYIDAGIDTRKEEEFADNDFEYDQDEFSDDEEKYNDIMDDFEKLYE